MSESSGQPAGWYDDPQDADYRRYWNGSEWSAGRMLSPTSEKGRRQRTLKNIANLVGLAVLVPFLLITFLPTNVGSFSCGTWLDRSHPVATGTYAGTLAGRIAETSVDRQCQQRLDDRRVYALVLLGLGVVLRFGIPIVGRRD